jgi:hypothetical protein
MVIILGVQVLGVSAEVDVSVNLTGQSLTTNLDDVTVNANANVNVTGQLLSANLDNVTITCRRKCKCNW